MKTEPHSVRQVFRRAAGGLVALGLLTLGVSALSNCFLPSGPRVHDRLDPLDIA